MELKKTLQMSVWLGEHQVKSEGSANFIKGVMNGTSRFVNASLFNAESDMSSYGYVKLGMADVSVTFVPPESLTIAELDMLNHELELVREKFHQAESALLGQISKLSALTFEGGEV